MIVLQDISSIHERIAAESVVLQLAPSSLAESIQILELCFLLVSEGGAIEAREAAAMRRAIDLIKQKVTV